MLLETPLKQVGLAHGPPLSGRVIEFTTRVRSEVGRSAWRCSESPTRLPAPRWRTCRAFFDLWKKWCMIIVVCISLFRLIKILPSASSITCESRLAVRAAFTRTARRPGCCCKRWQRGERSTAMSPVTVSAAARQILRSIGPLHLFAETIQRGASPRMYLLTTPTRSSHARAVARLCATRDHRLASVRRSLRGRGSWR